MMRNFLKRGFSKPTLILAIGVFVLTSLAAYAQVVPYISQGKRDPFMGLLQSKQKDLEVVEIVPPPPLDQRPPGLAGLLISEVNVSGTAQGSGRRLVILEGIDGMTYFAKEGSKLFDGYMNNLTGEQVVFIREQVDSRGNKKVSKVVKRIQTEDR